VPHRCGPVTVASSRLVRRAHAAGLPVHVWTIDDEPVMRLLLDRGVDGLMTDRTDILRDVLRRRGLWQERSDGVREEA
jgi:glycerophosphoryl diester phosphodiesterase